MTKYNLSETDTIELMYKAYNLGLKGISQKTVQNILYKELEDLKHYKSTAIKERKQAYADKCKTKGRIVYGRLKYIEDLKE